MTFRGIIFDFNGVLLWDTALQERAWTRYAAQLRGTPLTADEILHYVHGRPNAVTLQYLVGHPLPADEAERLSQEKERLYRRMCLDWGAAFAVSPGARTFLEQLAERSVPRTIATASERTNVHFFTTHLQLDRWFDPAKIVLDDGTFPGKPAPDIYDRAAAALGLHPAECVVVEDSVSGIEAARRAGIGRIYALGPEPEHARLAALDGVTSAICRVDEIPLSLFQEGFSTTSDKNP